MIHFENLDTLKKFLQDDRDKKTFSPIRFINVDSLNDWFAMKTFLETLTANFIFLSNYCAEDTFPNVRRLRQDLLRETRNICVLPLSEFLRVNPERAAYETDNFLNLHGGEIYSFRIYFLLYRLKNFLLSLKNVDPRQKDCVLLADSSTKDDYSLTIIQKSMQIQIAGERVDGFKKYFEYWEKSPNASLTLCTDNAVYLQDKKFFDDVKVIANAFELLRHHYNLPADFQKNFGNNDDWQRLAVDVSTAGNFEKTFCKEFKVTEFGINAFKNFGKREKFQRWLLWLRCKLQSQGYAARCARETLTLEDFAAQIYEKIFDCVKDKNFDELCDERREILALMKIQPSENYLERVKRAEKIFALKILNDHSQAERLMIFEILQRFKFSDLDDVLKILQKNFPALAKYLCDDAEIFTPEQAEYFRQYRWLKVTNQLTNDFYLRVTEFAQDKGKNIYALETRNKIVADEYTDAAAIFFVDGLGAEYINFLAADFASLKENFSVKYQVGRCNLPSVTENNKDFLQDRNVFAEILDLDTFKHTLQIYPENILGELKILVTLKEKILRGLDACKKIILCADHGTSRLAVLARQKKFGNNFPAENRTVYKNGRFADALPNDEKIFPAAVESDGKIIFADYSRFIQKGSAGAEIHGGATLEEILVPIITIERREKISVQKNKSPSPKKKSRGIADNKNFRI